MTTARKAAFNAASQRRVENAAQQSALGEALSLAGDWATQAAAMQQSLLSGLVRSQGLEAKRLAELYDKDDERAQAARDRSERYADIRDEIFARADQVGRVVDTFQSDGKFTGYVLLTDGEPAVGYVVALEVAPDAVHKNVRGGRSTTDATGWFSIDVIVPGSAPSTPIVDKPIEMHVQRFVEQMMGTPPEPAAPEAAHQVSNPPPPAQGQGTGLTTRAFVLDASGKSEVWNDPMPPTFAETTSEFRVYTQFNQASVQAGAGKARKR